ncbi:MAG: hypothetical protein K6E50_00480 [Lachnospiraceae bacterium]|nr:hypothetical protein [Lachnospiraceae bacterium]
MKYQYDKKDQKLFFLGAVLFSAVSGIALLLLLIDGIGGLIYAKDMSNSSVWSFIALQVALPATLLSWYAYLDCLLYERRLNRWGLELPESKKELLMPPADDPDLLKEGPFDKNSSLLSALCLVVLLGSLIYVFLDIGHFLSLNLGSDALAMGMLFYGPLSIAWLIGALVYRARRSNNIYRYAADPVPNKKIRQSLPQGLLTILLFLVISIFFLHIPHSMLDYAYKSRLEAVYDGGWREHLGEPLPPGSP